MAKIKIAELENEYRKEEVIKNGLFEKVGRLELIDFKQMNLVVEGS